MATIIETSVLNVSALLLLGPAFLVLMTNRQWKR